MAQQWPVNTQTIVITEQAEGLPVAFTWHGRVRRIKRVMADWLAEGDWWSEDGGEQHRYLLIQTENLVLTLAHDLQVNVWSVAKLAD